MKRLFLAVLALLVLVSSIISCEPTPTPKPTPAPTLTPVPTPAPSTPTLSPPEPEEEYVPNQIIVKFKPDTQIEAQEQLHQEMGSTVVHTNPAAGFQVLQIPEGKTVEEMVAIYSAQSIVEYAEPNYIVHLTWSPNDPGYSLQWHFDQINLEAAWDLDTSSPNYGGDSSIVVAVIDTGVAYETYGGYLQAPNLASFYNTIEEFKESALAGEKLGNLDDVISKLKKKPRMSQQ